MDVSTHQRPVLHLALSTQHGPELHPDLSGQQEPVLLLGMSKPQGPELHLDVSGSGQQEPVMFLEVHRAWAAPWRVWTTGSLVAEGRVYSTLHGPELHLNILYLDCWNLCCSWTCLHYRGRAAPGGVYTTEAWAAPGLVWQQEPCCSCDEHNTAYMERESIEWFLEIQAFLRSSDSAPRPPLTPLSHQKVVSHSQFSYVLLSDGREGEGQARSQIIRPP